MRLSNEPDLCVLTGAYCSKKDCPLYRDDECEFIKAIHSILATFAPAKVETRPPREQAQQPLIPKTLKPFPTLEPGKYLQEITGEVVDNPEIREVNTKDGPKPIANFYLTDGQRKIRVAMWEALADEVKNLKSGDVITLKGMSIRPPYEGEEQISSTRKTEIA